MTLHSNWVWTASCGILTGLDSFPAVWLTPTAIWRRSAEHRSDASFVHSLYIQQTCNHICLFVCVGFSFGKNEKLLRRVKLPSQSRLTLTVPSPTCHFSSFQTALLRSYCKLKETAKITSDAVTDGFRKKHKLVSVTHWKLKLTSATEPGRPPGSRCCPGSR